MILFLIKKFKILVIRYISLKKKLPKKKKKNEFHKNFY